MQYRDAMYHEAHQAEPYLPSLETPALMDLAKRVCLEAEHLVAKVPQSRRVELAKATRHENAATSNALENESRAEYLRAHELAELALDTIGLAGAPALGTDVLRRAHQELYSMVVDSSVSPGDLRTQNVKVQWHVAPHWESVPAFLSRADEVYRQIWKSREELLIAAAAAHHRFLWIHPFIDGNGRAIRMQSQLALRALGSDYWSLSNGLLRRRDDYYRTLSDADSRRLGDLDGRGNLSLKRLVEWCEFFVEVCREEIQAASLRL